jgi:hypothetical protein
LHDRIQEQKVVEAQLREDLEDLRQQLSESKVCQALIDALFLKCF